MKMFILFKFSLKWGNQRADYGVFHHDLSTLKLLFYIPVPIPVPQYIAMYCRTGPMYSTNNSNFVINLKPFDLSIDLTTLLNPTIVEAPQGSRVLRDLPVNDIKFRSRQLHTLT